MADYTLHHQHQLFPNIVPATRKDDPEDYVAKIFTEEHQSHLRNELAILLRLNNCPGIISFRSVVEEQNSLALITERMDGDLLELLDDR